MAPHQLFKIYSLRSSHTHSLRVGQHTDNIRSLKRGRAAIVQCVLRLKGVPFLLHPDWSCVSGGIEHSPILSRRIKLELVGCSLKNPSEIQR